MFRTDLWAGSESDTNELIFIIEEVIQDDDGEHGLETARVVYGDGSSVRSADRTE